MNQDWNPTDLRGQERVKAEQREEQVLAQAREDDDFTWLMFQMEGRRIMWRLLDQAGVFRLSFSQNSMVTSFNEGNRNYGLRVFAQINRLCPEMYALMVKENTNVRNDDGNADHSN